MNKTEQEKEESSPIVEQNSTVSFCDDVIVFSRELSVGFRLNGCFIVHMGRHWKRTSIRLLPPFMYRILSRSWRSIVSTVSFSLLLLLNFVFFKYLLNPLLPSSLCRLCAVFLRLSYLQILWVSNFTSWLSSLCALDMSTDYYPRLSISLIFVSIYKTSSLLTRPVHYILSILL